LNDFLVVWFPQGASLAVDQAASLPATNLFQPKPDLSGPYATTIIKLESSSVMYNTRMIAALPASRRQEFRDFGFVSDWHMQVLVTKILVRFTLIFKYTIQKASRIPTARPCHTMMIAGLYIIPGTLCT
jgi:hypothetical protein